MPLQTDVMEIVTSLKQRGEAFVLATVVRTVAVTAAKAGAKAVIMPDGSITGGWIGGGCARAAVLRAAQDVLADGQPRLISVQPPVELASLGVEPGESRQGVRFARNMCPSQGTMDIFVEPVMPRPNLVICGSSPVAVALSRLASVMGYSVTACAPQAEQQAFDQAETRVEGYTLPVADSAERFVVVSTQGKGDEVALRAILGIDARYKAFVGSRRKMAAIREKLLADGASAAALDAVKAPAGADIGAISPEEIALSIFAEITALRRRKLRSGPLEGMP
ncbi:MAG: XdhC family protein [Hyphomicrobiales bacterium]